MSTKKAESILRRIGTSRMQPVNTTAASVAVLGRYPQRRFLVYAIKLDPGVAKSKKFLTQNPSYVQGSDCYYVGMTGRTREDRFAQHQAGYKANRFARDHSIELMPDRFCHVHPKTYDEACRFERRLAERLRRQGCGVWQN